jgi:hypothetical protein
MELFVNDRVYAVLALLKSANQTEIQSIIMVCWLFFHKKGSIANYLAVVVFRYSLCLNVSTF